MSIGLSAAVGAGFCALAPAQQANRPADEPPAGRIVQPRPLPMPFSVDDNRRMTPPIEFRAADRITEQDRLLIANAQASIAETAGYSGLDFDGGGQWSYQQVVCPALPKHIFLRFLRSDGERDISMFSASIPRDQEGRVRIIPIRNRGYSLWSPAPINGLTIAAFNHIRLEENPDKAPVPDWLGTGLCYAALAGGHPQVGVPSEHPEKEKLPVAFSASLEVSDDGTVISFSDVGPDAHPLPRPMEWTMSFNGQGKLLKAEHTTAPLVQGELHIHQRPPTSVITRDIPPQSAAVESHPIPVTTLVANPVPAATVVAHPVAPSQVQVQ